MKFEWRVGWSASSNISFQGESEWWEEEAESEEALREELEGRGGRISAAFEAALEESGFEWWIDVRPAREGGNQ